MSEIVSANGEKSAGGVQNDGPWGEKYQKDIPPFNSDRKEEKSSDMTLDTGQGQFEYLDNYLSSKKSKWEHALEDDGYDSERVKPYIAEINYQVGLLESVHDEIVGGGDLTDVLARKYDEAYQAWEQDCHEQGRNYRDGESWNKMHYTENLCKTLVKQLTKNPQAAPYLSLEAVEEQSEINIRQAEIVADRKKAQIDNLSRMGNCEIDDKGIAHVINYRVDGTPVETTVDTNVIRSEIEDAEIDMKEAIAEKEVWGDLLKDDSSPFEHKTPFHTIAKKSDLKPDVIKYIDERTPQIKQLIAESRTLKKGTPEYQENEMRRRQLARERSAARRILVKYFSEEPRPTQGETQETEQDTQIDVVSVMDQMDAERDTFEKNLEKLEAERQRRLDWEKSHYGYVEGESRAPISVLAAEKDISSVRSKIIQKEKDADLLYKVYKENGKSKMLSRVEAQAIIGKMVQERDAKTAAIDEELEKVEKKSEKWKQLKQERAEAYRIIPDDAVRRVLELFNKDAAQ